MWRTWYINLTSQFTGQVIWRYLPLIWLRILFLRENGRKSRQSDLQHMHGGFLGTPTLSAQTLELSPCMLQKAVARSSRVQLRTKIDRGPTDPKIWLWSGFSWTQFIQIWWFCILKKKHTTSKPWSFRVPIPKTKLPCSWNPFENQLPVSMVHLERKYRKPMAFSPQK